MATAKAIPEVNFDGDQLLKRNNSPAEPLQHVWVNADKHVSIPTVTTTDGADIRATIAVSGLKDGEWVQLFFRVMQKRTGEERHVSGDDPVYIFASSVGQPSVHFTFADSIGAASGWQSVLRIAVRTNSETATIRRRQIRGWQKD